MRHNMPVYMCVRINAVIIRAIISGFAEWAEISETFYFQKIFRCDKSYDGLYYICKPHFAWSRNAKNLRYGLEKLYGSDFLFAMVVFVGDDFHRMHHPCRRIRLFYKSV